MKTSLPKGLWEKAQKAECEINQLFHGAKYASYTVPGTPIIQAYLKGYLAALASQKRKKK